MCPLSAQLFLAQTSSCPKSTPIALGRSKFPSLKYLTSDESQSPSQTRQGYSCRRKTVYWATRPIQAHPMIPMRIPPSFLEQLHVHNPRRCHDSGDTSDYLKEGEDRSWSRSHSTLLHCRQSHVIVTRIGSSRLTAGGRFYHETFKYSSHQIAPPIDVF